MTTEFQNFFAETKKIFKSCTFACVNIDGRNVWGDFKNRKEATEALKLWSRAFKGECKAQIVDNKYRISVSF